METLINGIIFIFWTGLTIGGSAYLVFWRGRSPWWMLLGVILACSLKITDSKK